MNTLKQLKSKLKKDFGWENLESDDNKWFVDNLLKDTIQAIEVIRCSSDVVSFSLFDKVYMDSPFGRYTGVVKGVEESKVIIESHSPMGNGTMLADYDLSNNDWQKY